MPGGKAYKRINRGPTVPGMDKTPHVAGKPGKSKKRLKLVSRQHGDNKSMGRGSVTNSAVTPFKYYGGSSAQKRRGKGGRRKY